jgi:hypothetical protein
MLVNVVFYLGDGLVSSVTSLPMVKDWGGWMEEMVFYGVIMPLRSEAGSFGHCPARFLGEFFHYVHHRGCDHHSLGISIFCIG